MDKRAVLRSMVTNLINDKSEEASLDFHSYLVDKMRDTAGLSAGVEQPAQEVEQEEEEEAGDE